MKNTFKIPDLQPMYDAVRDFVKRYQGEDGFILTENKKCDPIYVIEFNFADNTVDEYHLKAARVEGGRIQILTDLFNVTYDMDAVKTNTEDSWMDIHGDPSVDYVSTIFRMAESIAQYVSSRDYLIGLIRDAQQDGGTLLQVINKYNNSGAGYIAFDWRRIRRNNLPEDALLRIALEVLRKHHGKYDNAIECLYQLLTGKGFEKDSVIDALELDGCRVCSECGRLMVDGYVVNDGEEYFCSDKCAHKRYTPEEFESMLPTPDNEDSAAYWTSWEC